MPGDPSVAANRIVLLERQLERERRARRESEMIAESSLRELWLANRALDARVVERTAALEASLGAASAAVEAKQSFLAHLGHTLSSPLHAALGNLELIDTTGLPDEDHRRMMTVNASLQQLAGVLDGLMTLAASEGTADPTSGTAGLPDDFLDDLSARWFRRLAARGQLLVAELEGDTTSRVVDWHRLARVADALLANVVQHAIAGRVLVRLTVLADRVELAVCDSGPGIPAELRRQVLTPFFRLDAAPGSAKSGAGVGLAVVQRLVEGAGGTVLIDELDGGTAVKVSLPAQH